MRVHKKINKYTKTYFQLTYIISLSTTLYKEKGMCCCFKHLQHINLKCYWFFFLCNYKTLFIASFILFLKEGYVDSQNIVSNKWYAKNS